VRDATHEREWQKPRQKSIVSSKLALRTGDVAEVRADTIQVVELLVFPVEETQIAGVEILDAQDDMRASCVVKQRRQNKN
jgi:hypothetical protein